MGHDSHCMRDAGKRHSFALMNTEDEFDDDYDDEEEEGGLESSAVQWLLWPMYIVIFIVFLFMALCPFWILSMYGWATYEAMFNY